MTDTRSTTSEVEVPIDPDTAFTVFTEELDLWWVRGPINSYGAEKLVELRIEPGIGGRMLEVYDAETAEGMELGRITAWEPGKQLSWKSSLDDVTMDVRFAATATGTLVRLEATIPDGGRNIGGGSMVRMAPQWFPRWVVRRGREPHELHDLARFAVTVHYARPAAAARFLRDVFRFDSPTDLPTGDDPLPAGEYGHPWLELHAGNCSVVVAKLVGPEVDHAQVTHEPWVYVDDVEAHLAHAEAGGATIAEPLHTHGFTSYVALDPEGRRWRFAAARPTQPR